VKRVIALIILSSFLLPGCSQKEVDHNLVQMRSGIAYLPNESEPFSGTATAYYPSGQKQIETSYKDGMPTAKKLEWYANGQIKTEQHYSGEDIGRIRDWYENGEVSRDIRILNRTLVGKNVWRSLDFEGEINSFNGLIDGVHIYNFKDDTFSQNNAKGLPLSSIEKIKSESSNLSDEVIYEYNQDGSEARLASREYRYEYKSEQTHWVTEVKLENAEAKIITKNVEQNKDEDPTTVTTEKINKWFDMTPVKITVKLENGSYMMEASSSLKTFSLETGLLDGPSWHTDDFFLKKYSYSQGILNGYSDSFDRTTATWSEDCYILGEWEFDEEICKALFGEWNPPLNKNIPKHIKHLIDQDKEKAAKAKEEERKKKAEEERKKKAEEERKKKAEEERKKKG
jgi:antitoxin component YwqK of YwqJK toxin-antitoxin module